LSYEDAQSVVATRHVDDVFYPISFLLTKEAANELLRYFEEREEIMQILRLHPLTNLHPHVAAFVKELRRVTKK